MTVRFKCLNSKKKNQLDQLLNYFFVCVGLVGLEIVTDQMLVRIFDNIIKITSLNLLTMKKVLVNGLDSSIGLIAFCARAIPST